MTEYAFATTWDLEAPLDRVWAVLSDPEGWRTWFPALRAVRIVEPGADGGAGGVLEATVRAVLPYDLRFRALITRIEPPLVLELRAVGDLDGSGRWTLAEEEGVTTARFEWHVATTKAWMNALAPVARPLFAWNHDVAMTAAGRGLARTLGVRLLANDSGPVERSAAGPATAVALTTVVVAGTALALARRRSRGA